MKRSNGLTTFYVIILTQAFSMIGSRMSGLAVGIWLFQQTGNVTPLALVAFFGQLAFVLGINVAGVVADRYDRRRIMILADTGQAICTLLLLILFATDNFRVEFLYALTFVQSLVGTFQVPTLDASVALLVPDKQRDRANAIRQLVEPAGGLIAPAAASLLYALVNIEGVIVFDLLTFGTAMAVMLIVHLPRPERPESKRNESLWEEFTAGFRFVWAYKPLLGLLLLGATVNFLGNGIQSILTPYILLRTHDNTALLGVLLTVMSAGAIVGGVVIGAWGGTRPRIHTILPAVILAGMAQTVYGMGQHPAVLGAAMFGMMFFPALANAPLLSIWQSKVPADMQGRVFATMIQIAMLTTPIAQALVGPLADNVFEPAVRQPGWQLFAPLVGADAGAGIGLMAVICGLGVMLASALCYVPHRIRHMEQDLPDAVAVTVPAA